MFQLWLEGAFLGSATPEEAFQIRCDRSTMSQNDLDNGRIVVVVSFRPAVPIEQIVVVLAMGEGPRVEVSHARVPTNEALA